MTDFFSSFDNFNESVEKTNPTYSGVLGIPLNGVEQVEHRTRAGFVYVRLRDNLSEVIHAFNDKVSPVYNLPVIVERRGNKWFVTGRDIDRYSTWGTSAPFLPKHGFQHSFDRENGTGGDTTLIFPDQFMPLLVYPSGTGAGNLQVAPYILQRSSDFIYVGGSTQNLLVYRPADGNAVMGLVYLNTTTGNIGVLINSGSSFSSSVSGSSNLDQYIPYPASNQEPLYAFRLTSGTESLQWENLLNVRQFFGGGGGGSGSSGGASNLSDLNDVDISSPTLGDYLVYDGANWANNPSSVGAVDGGDAFAGLPLKIRRDLEANWISENPILEEGELAWVTDSPQSLRIGNGSDDYLGLALFDPPNALDDLTDVDISGAADGEFLRHDGTSWKNAVPSAANGTFTTTDLKTVTVVNGVITSIV